MKHLKYAIYRLFHPSQWFILGEYNELFDIWLNKCIDQNIPFVSIAPYKARIDDVTLWIGNHHHPYMSHSLYESDSRLRASAWTIMRAKKHLNMCIYIKNLKNQQYEQSQTLK
jgi:hypothetical protein